MFPTLPLSWVCFAFFSTECRFYFDFLLQKLLRCFPKTLSVFGVGKNLFLNRTDLKFEIFSNRTRSSLSSLFYSRYLMVTQRLWEELCKNFMLWVEEYKFIYFYITKCLDWMFVFNRTDLNGILYPTNHNYNNKWSCEFIPHTNLAEMLSVPEEM